MTIETASSAREASPPPKGDFSGFLTYFRYDALSGFLVFLIALPLCLGISSASEFPIVAGVLTAIVGAVIAPLISNSELTIKGPAAGLIVISLGIFFDLGNPREYTFGGAEHYISEKALVKIPSNLWDAITFPNFESLKTFAAWKWIFMFALIGSLESILSAKAVDMLDPYRRKSNLNRDLMAVGVGNTISSAIGGLPMISEIVRSKANIDNGAKTRFANFWHGVFL